MFAIFRRRRRMAEKEYHFRFAPHGEGEPFPEMVIRADRMETGESEGEDGRGRYTLYSNDEAVGEVNPVWVMAWWTTDVQ